jgi:LysR family transcriptional regulator, carnitine catabolism transcriptional activator
MDLRKLTFFVAVVDHGTFTKAAASVFVSQPGLSQGIRDLEAEVGTPLFDRIGRRVQLTDAGRALEEPARQALRQINTATAAIAAVRGLESGHLDLACLPTLAADPTAALIGRFRGIHPGIRISLADPDDPDDLLGMIRSGFVEVAITERFEPAPDIVQHDIGIQRLVMIRPPGSPALTPSTFGEMADASFIATAPGTSLRHALDELFLQMGRKPNVVVETSQREAIVPLVLAGAGAALVTEVVAEWAMEQGVVRCDSAPVFQRHIVVAHRAQTLSPAAAAFLKLVT